MLPGCSNEISGNRQQSLRSRDPERGDRGETRYGEEKAMRVAFDAFVLDTDTRQLTRGDESLRLSPKAFRLLELLIAARPRALAKDELIERLWPDTFVVEANLSNLVGELRAALGDASQRPRFIRTLQRFGYAFIHEPAGETPPSGERRWEVSWVDGRRELGDGAHFIGRAPEADVRLISASVSRIHACIRVSGDAATYEDLGSKNGSRRNGDTLTGAVTVAPGEVIVVGAEPVTFTRRPHHESTETIERRALRTR
jgi:DNA-binding winged helix-turn-helix (wHTH) protein